MPCALPKPSADDLRCRSNDRGHAFDGGQPLELVVEIILAKLVDLDSELVNGGLEMSQHGLQTKA